jgi:RHS repeat-associated protein
VTAVINKYKFSNDPNTIAFRKYSDIGLDYYNINTAMGNEGRQEFAGTDNSTNADVFTNYYYIKDHLGSTRMTLSGAGDLNFNRVEATMYESYGAMDPVIVSSTVNPAREKFTGKEFDKEGNENGGTGINLFYFGARYYDPEIGMWTSADKAGQFWNPYGYANNPIIMVDEDGNLFGIDDILIGIAVSMSINVISQGVSEATNENYKPNLGSFLASGLAGAVTGGFVGSTGLTSALGNALSGGTYQGATTAFNGGTFAQSARAFGLGFLGGAMIGGSAWAGGKIAQQDFAFSGLLGRGVASYGGTVARNLISGINGADAFNDLDINMWGIDLDFQNIGSRNADFNWSVDLGTIQGLYEINKAGGKWDWKSSLMSGSFVFRNAKGFPHVYGWGKGNAVTTTEWSEGVNETYGSRLPQIFQTRSVLAHEYMHTTASSFLPNITYNHLLYDYPIPWIIANTFNVYLGNPFESLPRLFQEY